MFNPKALRFLGESITGRPKGTAGSVLAKVTKNGNKMINARSEGVASKPAFRQAFQKQRCLVLADGFYKWKKMPESTRKQPYRITMKSGETFTFAGLWESWRENEVDQV